MQRYDLVGDYYLSMAPISDGDYVLYEDAKAEIDRLRIALEKYRGQINLYGEHTAADDLMMLNVVHNRLAEGLPIIPPLDPIPQGPADGAVAICGLCGLRVMPAMGYVCNNPRCGLFPQVTCTT